MRQRGSTRRGSVGLGVVDAMAIILVILILGGSLGALLASRDTDLVSRAHYLVRLALDSVSLNSISPDQASAEAPPSKGHAAGS